MSREMTSIDVSILCEGQADIKTQLKILGDLYKRYKLNSEPFITELVKCVQDELGVKLTYDKEGTRSK